MVARNCHQQFHPMLTNAVAFTLVLRPMFSEIGPADNPPCRICRTKDNQTCLQLAIKRHLPVVVDALCQRGANMNIVDESGDCPLWQALETGQEDIASTLVNLRTLCSDITLYTHR